MVHHATRLRVRAMTDSDMGSPHEVALAPTVVHIRLRPRRGEAPSGLTACGEECDGLVTSNPEELGWWRSTGRHVTSCKGCDEALLGAAKRPAKKGKETTIGKNSRKSRV